MLATAQPRRDWSDKTPAFKLTDRDLARIADVIAIAHRCLCDPAKSIDLELQYIHQAHCYEHRPILGLANSLGVRGDIAFDADWAAHRAEHMAEARAEWGRVTAAPALAMAA